MSRLVVLAVAACLLAPGDVSAKRRKGRKGGVVRVERVSSKVTRQPRVVQVSGPTQLMSFGWEPEVGTEVTLVDTERVVGRGRIVAVTEIIGSCQSGTYNLEFEMEDWAVPYNYNLRGVAGYDLGEDARWIQPNYQSPTGNPNEYVWAGIDNDGDGSEDLIVTTYPCADTEAPGAAIGTMSTAPYCWDTYARDSVDAPWERVTHDVYYQCH